MESVLYYIALTDVCPNFNALWWTASDSAKCHTY